MWIRVEGCGQLARFGSLVGLSIRLMLVRYKTRNLSSSVQRGDVLADLFGKGKRCDKSLSHEYREGVKFGDKPG